MTTIRAPVLGLLVTPDPPAGFAWLVRQLGRWCTPAAVERGSEPDAFLASSRHARGLAAALSSGRPVAVWIDDDDPTATLRLPAALLLTADLRLAGSDRFLYVPPENGVDADAIPPIAPFLRARIRRREGLPARMVIDLRSGELTAEAVPAALAVCSACVATGDALPYALAWAAPTITDAASAGALCARAGRDVEVGEDAALAGLAHRVAGDERRAASLSRRGRGLIESLRRRGHVPPAVAMALGLFAAPGSRPRVEAVLDTMNTPGSAAIRRRVRAALSPYANAGAFVRSD
ncbi:MAG TPA: hypothetical protein VF155_08155 [Candidatus Dormibacteraeota bacterium]